MCVILILSEPKLKLPRKQQTNVNHATVYATVKGARGGGGI